MNNRRIAKGAKEIDLDVV